MRMKKRTIFSLFVVPLILVMMVQAMISYGTFFFSGTPFLLKEYSVGILNQTVENRKIPENTLRIKDIFQMSD